MSRGDERKRTIRLGVETVGPRSKLNFYVRFRISLGETCLLPKRAAA